MFSRAAMSIAAAWAVFMIPALCVGGVVLHECSTCIPADACDHETGCAEDPCSPVLKQRGHGAHAADDLVPVGLPSTAEITGEWHSASRAALRATRRAASIRPTRFLDSGLPLLN